MIFRQFFDLPSSTYTYLISSGKGREALIIDPVFEKTDQYIQLLKQLELKLVKVIDTHIHADHISGLSDLRDKTKCITLMGEHAPADVVSMTVKDNETINIENIQLISLYTPGHTDDSYSFVMEDRIFTGDTLLIKGTGRTDFQNGNPYDQYNSLFERILKLPEDTFIYPAHDYKGENVSTIGEEKKYNPRLQVTSSQEYANIMNNLNLDDPKLMDIAIPANKSMGITYETQKKLNGISYDRLKHLSQKSDCILSIRVQKVTKSNFFFGKGTVAALMERLGLEGFTEDSTDNDIFAEGISLKRNKEKIVEFGIVKQKVTKELDVDAEIFFADFNWDAVLKQISTKNFKLKPIAKFQAAQRDFALLLDNSVRFGDLQNAAFNTEKKFLKAVTLFDVYKGKNLPEGKKSYALSFTIQDEEKTLTDKQIDKIMGKLQQKFENEFGATLR